MKKLSVVFICLLAFTLTAFSQQSPTFVYAEIIGEGRLFSNKLNIVLDFGQQMKTFDNRLRNEHGKPREFNSMVDALNFMGKQGWEFIQTYAVALPNDINEYHYVIKKKFDDLDMEEKKMFMKEYN